MKNRTYLLVVAVVFSLVAVFHLLRLILRWDAIIGGWVVPFWVSLVGFVIAGLLAIMGFKSSKNR